VLEDFMESKTNDGRAAIVGGWVGVGFWFTASY